MMILPRKFVDIEMPGAVGMSGEYRLRVIRHDGTVRQDTDWFPNIILDAGLNRWGTGGIITGAAVGTGNSTPTAAQTQLDIQTTFTTTQGTGDGARTAQGSAPYYATYTAVYRTAVGALNGIYSEVGIGWASNQLFSRALILNNVGVATTITITSTEQLDISYRLRIYPPAVDVTSVAVIGGVSYNVTGRASGVTSVSGITGTWFTRISGAIGPWPFDNNYTRAYSGAIGAITGEPSGSNASTPASTVSAYSNNSFTMAMASAFGLTEGNVGGILALKTNWSMACFQYGFSAAIPKDSTKTLVLNTSISWARRP